MTFSFSTPPDHPFLLLFLIAANGPVYRYLLSVLFDGADDLGESIRYWFTPDFYSWYKNRQFEDMWAELRLTVLVLLSVACVGLEYALVIHFLDWWYSHVVCCAPTP